MLKSLIGSVKNGVKKVGVTVFAGYSALVIGLGSCGDTNNYYGETGGEVLSLYFYRSFYFGSLDI